ncbi:MAG: cysteine dioxygenase family protein [Cyanobacteria bacterium J06621_8]
MTQAVELACNRGSVGQLPQSLQSLIGQLSQSSYLTPKGVYQSLVRSRVTQDDLMPWATFNHPVTDGYGRQLVYDGGYFEIMVMSWLPGDVSAIHDHGHTQWGAVQCFGSGTHTVYRLQSSQLSTIAEISLFPTQIMKVDHDLIHQMSNYSQECFLSLHVYGCYQSLDSITGDARIFDLLEGRIQCTSGGVFFCLPETEINYRGSRITADLQTTYRHHRQMRDRILRILKTDSNTNLEHWHSKLAQLELELTSCQQSMA